MTEHDKNNIMLAEYVGYKTVTISSKDKDFDEQMKKSDLVWIGNDEIKFTKGEKAGNKWSPFFKCFQAEMIIDKIISENKGCVLLITSPVEKNDNWSFSIGDLLDKKENQYFVTTEVCGVGNKYNKARYDFMLKYVSKRMKK